jgi:hypothetical protein
MKPEEIFKINDGEILEDVKEETPITSEKKSPEKKQIDVFDKNLTIEDLIDFLKQNGVDTNKEIVEKNYQEIINNNSEKETIIEAIKELDTQRETLIREIEIQPNNRDILKKISNIEEKISDLNTEERIREDGVKTIIKNIQKTEVENLKSPETSKIEPETVQNYEEVEIKPEEVKDYEAPKIEPETVQNYKEVEIKPEEVKDYEAPKIEPETVQSYREIKIVPEKNPEVKENDTSDDLNFIDNQNIDENFNPKNPIESIDSIESNQTKENYENIEKNETLEEIKKSNKMLENMSKDITTSFEIVLKTITENLQSIEMKKDDQIKDDSTEPTHVENPKISQPDYISEYRSSLRKYSGISPFIGYETNFKGDNLGSYI